MTQVQHHDPMTQVQPSQSGGGGKKFLLIGCLGCAGVTVIGVIVVVALLVWLGSQPTMSVQTHNSTPPEVIQALQDASLLDDDERIIMIYSAGMTSMKDDGLYFTDRRVVSYLDADDSASASEASYDQIVDIYLEPSESFIDDSFIIVDLDDGTQIIGPVNNLDGEDTKFYNRLLQEWRQQTGRAP